MSVVFLLIALLACGHINTSTAILTTSYCRKALDVCFVLDGSTSNFDDDLLHLNWDLILESVKNMAGRFDIGPDDTQVGLVTFGDATKVEFNLTKHQYKLPLLADILDTKFPGGELNTPGLAAVMAGVFSTAAGARSDTRNISVLYSDGAPAISLAGAEAASTMLQNAGVEVYVVCIQKTSSSGCTEEFAKRLSSPPKEKDKTYFLVTYASLFVDILKVLEQVCGSGDYK